MNRTQKEQQITQLRTAFGSVRHAIVIEYRGISVPQVTELRSQVRKSGGRYAVVKNTLLVRAIQGAPLEKLKAHLRGPTAIAWSEAEPVLLAKTLTTFAKTAPVLQFRAVLLDGEVLPANQLETVAGLPSKEELRGRMVSLLASPLRRLVTALSAPSRDLASVVKQRAEKMSS